MTNCKNCGAILTGNLCEYCGTRYDIIFDEKINVEVNTSGFGITMEEAVEAFNNFAKITGKHSLNY